MGRVDQSAGFNPEHVIGRILGQFSLVCLECSTCDVNTTCEHSEVSCDCSAHPNVDRFMINFPGGLLIYQPALQPRRVKWILLLVPGHSKTRSLK